MKNPEAVDREFARVPAALKSSARLARLWALDRLMHLEGSGHDLHISRKSSRDNRIVCSFAKPSWPGDHCGTPQKSGAEAIIRSVLEYELGW